MSVRMLVFFSHQTYLDQISIPVFSFPFFCLPGIPFLRDSSQKTHDTTSLSVHAEIFYSRELNVFHVWIYNTPNC